MLTTLILKNLILIDSCQIDFSSGLTIISGETGSGKTAITEGLALCLGERADSSCVRKGEEKAVIEAAFEELIIRREITRDGKSRAFINGEMVPLSALQKLKPTLVDLMDQTLSERENLDLFADVANEMQQFQTAWDEEKLLEEGLSKLQSIDAVREKTFCEHQFEELEKANFQEGEEEKLFEEYKELATTAEAQEKLQAISIETPLMQVNRFKSLTQIKELNDLLQEASIALQEAARFLSSTLNNTDLNTVRFGYLEERLSLLNRLKRKYGQDLAAVKASFKEKLVQLENLEEEKSGLTEKLIKAKERSTQLVELLTQKRKAAAPLLADLLQSSLRDLNMPHAEMSIKITPQARSQSGEDYVVFWLKANKGESLLPIKDHVSGGELCRLQLALKTALAEKNNTPTIIFDEIDANIGGETASMMGEKLSQLGKHRQVICITHFPQVAAKADHHFAVEKQEIDGRTVSTIKKLNKLEKEKELLRMLGGTNLLTRGHP